MSLNRIHCSYHKCLTVFFGRVFRTLYNRLVPFTGGYRHFWSFREEFYATLGNYRVAYISNHALDLDRLGNFRLTRFIRDPRDLIVSGYFYHRRGAEEWCRQIDPTDEDWTRVNGVVPDGLKPGESYAAFLKRVDKETGLIAEIQFRRKHFESMMDWPSDDARIRLFRYEDIVGNELQTIGEICRFYQLSVAERWLGQVLAEYFSAKRQVRTTRHIRNPSSGQWKEHFSSKVDGYFHSQYNNLLEYCGYE